MLNYNIKNVFQIFIFVNVWSSSSEEFAFSYCMNVPLVYEFFLGFMYNFYW